MSDVPPTAFVSHASEDKAKYAEPLARALRASGIEAWLDQWEIHPGDSLVQKVFEEGLGGAGTVVFVMTPTSLAKPWVRAELDNAVARHVEGEIRLVPVMAEPCEPPQSVRAILWVDVTKEGSVEKAAERIVRAIHGATDRPPLGPAPTYAQPDRLKVPGLDNMDALTLELVFQAAMVGRRALVQWPQIKPFAEPLGLDHQAIKESTDLLCEQGYLIQKGQGLRGRYLIVGMSARVFLGIAEALGMRVADCHHAVAGFILNEEIGNVATISERSGYPESLVDAVVEDFEGRGFVRVARTAGGTSAGMPSASFKRWFRDA